jgi:hypothetical protein
VTLSGADERVNHLPGLRGERGGTKEKIIQREKGLRYIFVAANVYGDDRIY